MNSDYDCDTACETCESPCETPIGKIAEIGGLTKPAKPRLNERSLNDFLDVIKTEYLPTFRWSQTTKRYGASHDVNMRYNFRDEWKDRDLGGIESFLKNDGWNEREQFYYSVFNYVLELIFDLKGKYEAQRKVF